MARVALIALALIACGSSPKLLVALEHGDVAAARTLVDGGAPVDASDADGNSVLMLAVRYGDAALVRAVLARHPDVGHANAAGATALHGAIDDADKVRALLAAGAPVDAADAHGMTSLMLAAERDDGWPVVEILLAHGADARRVRGGLGAGDPRTLRALLDHGAELRETALITAARDGNAENVRTLLARKAPVDAHPGPLGMTALMWAAEMGRAEAVTVLLAAGADPNRHATFNGTTALIQAAASDRAGLAIVEALLAAHADTQLLDDEGASALDWALRRGDAGVIAAIAAHEHAPSPPRLRQPAGTRAPARTPAAAIARAIPLLEHSRRVFRERSGCPSCHHDALVAIALARAKSRGIAIDDAAYQIEARATVDALAPARGRYAIGYGFADVLEPAYLLVGMHAAGHPRDALTDAMARYLELAQAADGRWATGMQRIPVDGSDVAFTALAVRALALYGGSTARIARGRAWLAGVTATTNEDRTYQLLGLAWAGAPATARAPLVEQLLATQRADGGFAQTPGLRSDAYATAQAIVALRDAGDLPATHPAIDRAVRWLLAQQYADGSWFVASRALRFQPWFDSDFPHGRSQYMSAAATAWAVLALASV
jgi:ankyrin repeat protein